MIKCPECKRGKKFIILQPPKVLYNHESRSFFVTMFLQCANCKKKLTPRFTYNSFDAPSNGEKEQ